MTDRIEQSLDRLASAIVGVARLRPWVTLAVCLVLTVAAALVAATQLAVHTDPDFMTSPDLEFRKTNSSLREAFPELQNNFVVLIEAEEREDARAAAVELAARLEDDSDRFSYVYLPGADPFYRDNGLLYSELSELERTAERLEQLGPLLLRLSDQLARPSSLTTTLGTTGASSSHGDVAPEAGVRRGLGMEPAAAAAQQAALRQWLAAAKGLGSLGDEAAPVLERLAIAVERFNRGERDAVAWEELFFAESQVRHLNPQLLFVKPTADLSRLDASLESLARVREAAAGVTARPGLNIRVTGDRAVHTEEMSLLLGETVVAGAFSLLLVALILYFALQSFRLQIATVVTLLVGLVWTAGFAGAVVGHLNMLTTAFAVLYIGLGVDFGIHFAVGYLEGRRRGEATAESLRHTGRRVGSSLLFCTLSTAVGFYAFIPTTYTGVAELGVISGTGIFLSLIATLTLYPALIELGMGESPKLTAARRVDWQLPMPKFPIRYPRTVCAVAAGITLAALATLPFLRFDMNPQNVRDPRVESVQAMEDLLGDPEISAWTVEFLSPDLAAADALAQRLEAVEEVQQVHTLASFLPENQAAKLALLRRMRAALTPSAVALEAQGPPLATDLAEGNHSAEATRLREALAQLEDQVANAARQGTMPLDLAALQQDLFGGLAPLLDGLRSALPSQALTVADLPESLALRYLSSDGRARVEVLSSLDLRQTGGLEVFADAVAAVQPSAGGPVVANVELGRAIIHSLRQAFLTALVVIAALLLLLWQSPKYVLITLTPLLIGSVATAAFTQLAGIHFNFANVVILPLILGIGVDSGIHLVHRHRTGLMGADTILRTGTAQAVFFSAMTTLVSFSTLGLSHHLGIASFAQLLTVGISFMLIANLLVLPAILEWVDGKPR